MTEIFLSLSSRLCGCVVFFLFVRVSRSRFVCVEIYINIYFFFVLRGGKAFGCLLYSAGLFFLKKNAN